MMMNTRSRPLKLSLPSEYPAMEATISSPTVLITAINSELPYSRQNGTLSSIHTCV